MLGRRGLLVRKVQGREDGSIELGHCWEPQTTDLQLVVTRPGNITRGLSGKLVTKLKDILSEDVSELGLNTHILLNLVILTHRILC